MKKKMLKRLLAVVLCSSVIMVNQSFNVLAEEIVISDNGEKLENGSLNCIDDSEVVSSLESFEANCEDEILIVDDEILEDDLSVDSESTESIEDKCDINGTNNKTFDETKSTEEMLTAEETLDAGWDTCEINEEDNSGISLDDYVPGEVIVCVKGGAKALLNSGLFDDGKYALNSDTCSVDDLEGLNCKLASTTVCIEDNLMSFEAKDVPENVIEISSNGTTDVEGNEWIDSVNLLNEDENEVCNLILLKSGEENVSDLISELEKLPYVVFAEPNIICQPTSYGLSEVENEPLYDYQWYLKNHYEKGAKADINATELYSNAEFQNQDDVVVAVMDTGVDYTHPDLVDSMWDAGESIPALEKLGGGKYGINTSGDGDMNDPIDAYIGHGTHCASIIAAKVGNKTGIAGVNGNAKIMACRWLGNRGVIADYITAVDYVLTAKENGVNVVAMNNSWGPAVSVDFMSKSVQILAGVVASKGIVTCFAAGNATLDHDRFTNLAISTPYIVTVGALNSEGEPACFTDYGASSVDVFAPGTQILAATSLQESVGDMQAQYLPWLQAEEDSFFYEDFEDVNNIDVTMSSYGLDETSENKEHVVSADVIDGGYLSDKAYDVKIDDNINSQDSLVVEIDIPLEKLIPGNELPENDAYYFAFEAGISNTQIDSELFEIEYCSLNEGSEKWELFNDNKKWFDRDRWTVCSCELTPEEMNTVIEAARTTGSVLKLRLIADVLSISEDAQFYIDSIGFGTKHSDYYYADGTSMATPIVTALVSLLAGSMETSPDNADDVLEIIARLKGGVAPDEKLSDKCVTMGYVQADCAYKSADELNPVPLYCDYNADSHEAVLRCCFLNCKEFDIEIEGKDGKASILECEDYDNVTNIIRIDCPPDAPYPYGLLEYRVKRADGKEGRGFGFFSSQKKGKGTYEELPVGDFDYGIATTKDLVPMRMTANDDGIMVILIEEYQRLGVLEFYSFATKKWEQISLPDGIHMSLFPTPDVYSLVGGKDQFYLLVSDNTKHKLLTYSTSEKKWLYSVSVTDNLEANSFLGIDNKGKLYIAGGMGSLTETGVMQIYPDTGCCSLMESELPEDYRGLAGGEYLISGDMKILAGLNPGVWAAMFESPDTYGLPANNPLVYTDGKWQAQKTPFYDNVGNTSDGLGGAGLDHNQCYLGAYGALDSGFILAGPARNIDKTDMVDTWIYDAKADTYLALDARVSGRRLEMQAGACRKGKFYVMGRDALNGNLIFKSLNLSDYNVTTTDNNMNAELDETSPCVTCVGSTWLDDKDGGYYVLDAEGKLTKAGADSQNYSVKYNSDDNKITLRNVAVSGMQCSKTAYKKSTVYSNKDLIVETMGNSSVTSTIDSIDDPLSKALFFAISEKYAVYCRGNITFTGDGNLVIDSGNHCQQNIAVASEQSIEFDSNGKLEIFADGLPKETNLNGMTIDTIAAYGVCGKNVYINSGEVNVNADSVTHYCPSKVESIGINADSVTVLGAADLTVKSGDVSGTVKLSSVAIETREPVYIGECNITTSVGKLVDFETKDILSEKEGMYKNRGFENAPVIMPCVDVGILYGDDKNSAEAAGYKNFDLLYTNLAQKYIHITAETSKPDIPVISSYRAHSLASDDIIITLSNKTDVNKKYTGYNIMPSVKVKYLYKVGASNKSTVLKENVDYKLFYRNNKDAGTATIRVYGIGAYCDYKEINFTIAARNIADKKADVKIATLPDIIYEGNAGKVFNEISNAVSVCYNNTELVPGRDFTVEKKSEIVNVIGTKGKTLKAKIVGKGNFTGEKVFSFKLVPAETVKKDIASCTVSFKKSNYTYTGKLIKPAIVVKDADGKVLKTKYYKVSYTNNKEVGNNAKVTVYGTGTYKGRLDADFSIVPKDIGKCKIYVSNSKLKYNGCDQRGNVGIWVKDGSNVLTEGIDYKIIYQGDFTKVTDKKVKANVPTITIEALNNGNYKNVESTKKLKKTFSIGKASIDSSLYGVTELSVDGKACVMENNKYVIPKERYIGSPYDFVELSVILNGMNLKGVRFDRNVSSNDNYTIKIKETKKKGSVVSGSITIKGINPFTGTKVIKYVVK